MFNWFCSRAVGGLPLLQRETRQMKTLINKANPAIRITAPEIGTGTHGYYYVDSVGYHKDKWTLVEEEPKYTEVWVEGRTIFEQDAKKPEVDLEKATEEYIEKRASLAPNESWDIEDMRAAVRFGAEWQKKQRNKELREKIGEYWNAGYEAGVEWAFKQFSDILDKWEAHAIEGMKVGASAYHQGKIALICDLRDWIKEIEKEDV